MTTSVAPARTRHAYHAAFAAECRRVYPEIDLLEARRGYAVNRDRLEAAARVLACPVKAHAPCWQHGRLIYAVARQCLALSTGPVSLLDIGTAKGFSALCLLWALQDADCDGTVTSVDVIDPAARVARNTVAELDGLLTLRDTLAPWPESAAIAFVQSTGVAWLEAHPAHLSLAFVDGKHSEAAVRAELALLAARQTAGDLVILDDLQIPGVAAAVRTAKGYQFEMVSASPERVYAIGHREAAR